MGDGAHSQGLWTDASAAVEQLLAAIRECRENGGPPGSADAPAGAATAVLTEAYLACVSAGLRCVSGLAGRFDAHRETIARLVLDDFGGLAEAERQAILAALRAMLGEIGEVAVTEATRLRAELDALGESIGDGRVARATGRKQRRNAAG